jgi:hypothetical protein
MKNKLILDGHIIEIKGTAFVGLVHDDSEANGTYEVITLNVSDVEETDRDLVQLGGLFTLVIYVQNGVKQHIIMDKVVPLTEEEIKQAFKRAEKLNKSLKWD